jgi:CRP-like cAMP-binding protein
LFVTPEEQDQQRSERHKEDRVHVLEHLEFLASLTPEERQFVAEHLLYAPFAAGEMVTMQGAVAHWLYILCTGKVEVRRHAEGAKTARVVATIDAPGFFGEMGMLTGTARRADVVALTDVECYRLDKEGLQRILTERPEIAAQISRTLAKRDVEMATVVEGLDEETRVARLATAETRILDKIQEFFGLNRTSIL